MESALHTVLVLLAAAVAVVVIFRLLRLPAMLGYLLAGLAIGPHALGFIADTPQTRYLAEFGVVFLMFSIGLEFSLPKLVTMKRVVLGLGSAQVGITLAVVLALALLLGLDWRAGVALGGVLAMSSTAIVSKMLSERLELNTEHGRQVIGVLLFQDLAVVPLLILIPALAAPAGELAGMLGLALAKATVALVVLLVVGQRLMRPWFHLVARQKSSELFTLNMLLITLGLAWLTELAGLSLALGAFLAGMLISETEYRYQVENDIQPFRDVLLGLFFVTIGAQLDLRVVYSSFGWVALILVAMLAGKVLLITLLSRAFGADTGVALRTGIILGQAGEFGFVLLSLAYADGIVPKAVQQPVLAAMLLSMVAAPFLIERAEHMARHFSGAEWMNRAMQLTQIATQTMAATGHVIICGYGRSGQNLARFLEQESIPVIALDLDPARIREAAAAGESVVYGDAAKREVLIAAGLMRASAVVITYADTPSALKVLGHVHAERPEMPVVVRTLDGTDLDRLKDAGAAEVVVEVLEGSLMLASHALMLLGVPLNRVLKRIRATREQRYALFRGFFPGRSDEGEEPADRLQPRLHSVLISPGAHAVGRTLGELNLEQLLVEATAVRRRNIRALEPSPETRLDAGDVVVLRGTPGNLAAAEIRLLQG